ncbi:hypothetical protein BS47DRAFT_1362763 [Hydnum rufescens UP504]|uniref:Uncharacterized protein n=1 Tax=Hydnum rufescens UP504 TaxID=1448309 RepID=A0A9P6DT94_9AGAM|nr:hypothetical protein BS47DRAFT_1362763 [Hydnum rufescens UP504]
MATPPFHISSPGSGKTLSFQVAVKCWGTSVCLRLVDSYALLYDQMKTRIIVANLSATIISKDKPTPLEGHMVIMGINYFTNQHFLDWMANLAATGNLALVAFDASGKSKPLQRLRRQEGPNSECAAIFFNSKSNARLWQQYWGRCQHWIQTIQRHSQEIQACKGCWLRRICASALYMCVHKSRDPVQLQGFFPDSPNREMDTKLPNISFSIQRGQGIAKRRVMEHHQCLDKVLAIINSLKQATHYGCWKHHGWTCLFHDNHIGFHCNTKGGKEELNLKQPHTLEETGPRQQPELAGPIKYKKWLGSWDEGESRVTVASTILFIWFYNKHCGNVG